MVKRSKMTNLLGLVGQNWLERDLSALLLRALAVGRQQQSGSIGVTLDLESRGLMNSYDIGRGAIPCKVSYNLASCNPPIAQNTFLSHV